MGLFGTLSAIYIIPTIYHDYRTLEVDRVRPPKEAADDLIVTERTLRVSPIIDADKFAENAVNAVRLKALAHRKNSTVK